MQAKGTVPGPHARTPAPRARSGQRTPTARREVGQPGEDERLTSDAPHNGAARPPQGTPSRQPHSAQLRLARAHAVRPMLGPPRLHHPCPGHMGNGSRLPAPRNEQPGEGQRLMPDAPHNGGMSPPRDGLPPASAARSPPRGMHAKGTVPGPNARTLRWRHVGRRPQQPGPRAGSGLRKSA